MASMSNDTRQRIIEVATANGFMIELKEDGRDLYDKNLAFGTRGTRVYIHRETGFHKTSGEISYLKVAVHPDTFKRELISPKHGILDYINSRSGVNRHHSSNYVDFPSGIPGRESPYGVCYKVTTLPGLGKLLAELREGV